MILQTVLLVIFSILVNGSEFKDDVCDGHHHQKHIWKTDIPKSPEELAELFRNKCLREPRVRTPLNPTERQYVTYRHQYDTHTHKFNYEDHTVENSVVDVFHNPDDTHRMCQEVEEATCGIPVIDLTDRVSEARGIHPNVFVLSYMLPDDCENCVAKLSLNVEDKQHHRRLSEHPALTGYDYDGHDNDGVTACNQNGIYALDPVEGTTVYRDDTGIPIYDIVFASDTSGSHCRFNVDGGPCVACVLAPDGKRGTNRQCKFTTDPSNTDLEIITPTKLNNVWKSGRTEEACANACDGLAGVGDDDLCYGFNFNPSQQECYFLVDDNKGICNTYARANGAYYYENPVRINTIFYQTPPSQSQNTLGGGAVSLPEVQLKRMKLDIANDGFPTEHVLKIKIIDPDSTTAESYHTNYVTVFIDADGHGEPHTTNPPDHNSGTDHLKITKINPVMNFDDNIPESVRDQFEIAQLYSDDPNTFGIRYKVDNQFLHFDTTSDDGQNIMAQDVAGNEPERAIYLDGSSWVKLTKTPTKAPTNFPTPSPRTYFRLQEVTTITETNGNKIFYWQVKTDASDDNSWRTLYYDTPASGTDDSDHSNPAWPHVFAPTSTTVCEVEGGIALSYANSYLGNICQIEQDINGNVIKFVDGSNVVRHIHIYAGDTDATPFSETQYSTWPLVRHDGFPLAIATHSPTAPTNSPTMPTASPTLQCSSGTKNGDEGDVDCGGSCPPCENGKTCNIDSDCASASCDSNICVDPTPAPTLPTAAPTVPATDAPTLPTAAPTLPTAAPTIPTCTNGAFDSGDETDVDCGGSCGPTCGLDKNCQFDGDCATGLSCITPAFQCKTTTDSPTTASPTTESPTTGVPTTSAPTPTAPTTAAPTHIPNKILFDEEFDSQYDTSEFYQILTQSIAVQLNISDTDVTVSSAVPEAHGFSVVFDISTGDDQTIYFDEIVAEIRGRLSDSNNVAFGLLSSGLIQMNSTLPSGDIQLVQLNTLAPTFPDVSNTFTYSFRHATDGDLHHQDIWKGTLVVASLVFAALLLSFCSHLVFGKKRYKKDYEKINQDV